MMLFSLMYELFGFVLFAYGLFKQFVHSFVQVSFYLAVSSPVLSV